MVEKPENETKPNEIILIATTLLMWSSGRKKKQSMKT